MKNKSKAFICSVLTAAMLLSAFASCAENREEENKKNETGPVVTDTNRGPGDFEEADYDETEFKFLIYDENQKDYADNYIWSDSVTGGAIGDAVMDRNRLVEERYNVIIAADQVGSPISEASSRMMAGQCDFDVIYEWGSRLVGSALDGQLLNFHELEHVDFEQSYWVPKAAEKLTIRDRMFIATNLITMNSMSWGGLLFFNKTLMDKLNYEYPYTYVENNTWTVDQCLEMLIDAEEDINGDGMMTLEDQYGGFGMSVDAALYNEPRIKENDDGTFTVIGYTEKMVMNYGKYKNIVDRASVISYEDVWDQVDHSIAPSPHMAVRFAVFGEDHALFMGGNMDITKELTNMKSDYGLVPVPKADPAEDYIVSIDSNAPMFGLPIQLEDPNMTGMILEYMAYESEENLLPTYYETTIKTKRMQDTRDYDTLEIIKSEVGYTWENLYVGGEAFNSYRGKMLASGNFESVWRRYGAKAQAELEEALEKIESIY